MWRWCVCLQAVLAAAGAPGNVPRCPPGTPGTAAACSAVTNGSGSQHQFQVCDKYLYIHEDGKTMRIVCQNNMTFECPSLPKFPNRVSVLTVTMMGCPLPAGGSVRGVLAVLNVTLLRGGRLKLSDLPLTPALAAAHFAGLAQLRVLELEARQKHEPDAGFLKELCDLHTLKMLHVQLPSDELASPRSTLRRLELRHAGVRAPPRPPLETVVYLKVEELELDDFNPPPGLTNLTLSSRATTLCVVDVPSLESLELTNWTERHPVPLQRCGALRSLWLTGPAVETLPARWLSACPALRKLVIRRARALTDLPALLLENATALEHLEVSGTAVVYLPEELLHGAPNLVTLNLSSNRLHALARSSLVGPRALLVMDLSHNELTTAAVTQLANLTRLRELFLTNNTQIGDLCAPTDSSPLIHMKNITTLNLSSTSVTRICRDWRVNLTELEMLSLQRTRVTTLQFEDFKYERRKATRAYVVLEGAPVSAVLYSRGQTRPAASGVLVQLDSELSCGCDMYWTRRALGLNATNVPFTGRLRCKGRRLLDKLSVDDMMCPMETCVAGCKCSWRDDDGSAAPGATQLVEVRCERANLTSVPRLPASPGTAYDLLLPHNRIANLSAGDLPPLLRHLDLTNNSVRRVDEVSAAQLAGTSWLLLAVNPLECDCGAAPLQRALAARLNATGARCRDGGALARARLEACAAEARSHTALLAAGLAGGLLALVAVAVAISAWLAPRDWWLAVKVPLHRRGLGRTQSDEAREYDAFLSFAHEDEERARVLVERLERGAPPYRLCVHYRDWVPGRLIERQLEESVARSHRTVALVSRHYLASRWARAEFRSAQALALRSARPRLVVVLLEPAEALPLDAELRSYLAANTYVRWGDPWFWDKLQLALPPPRRRASPTGS